MTISVFMGVLTIIYVVSSLVYIWKLLQKYERVSKKYRKAVEWQDRATRRAKSTVEDNY